jgi:SPX domain protein involved in polyphosphate accumulation
MTPGPESSPASAAAPRASEVVELRFDRYELKFLLHVSQARAVLETLAPYVRRDPNAGPDGFYKVTSLYLDSPDLACYREKLDGEKYRRKVRVRAYGANPADAFIEIKQRLNLGVAKRRTLRPVAHAERTIRELCSGRHSPGDAVLDEAFVLAQRERLAPKIVVSYNRSAWFDAWRKDLRVTLDRNLKWRTLDLALCGDPTRGRYVLPPEWSVLEVKFDRILPSWLCTALNCHDLEVRRFSKYAAAVEASGLAR